MSPVRFAAFAMLAVAPSLFARPPAPAPRPSPTPTARPRLSGGFGRTPVPPAARGETAPGGATAGEPPAAASPQAAGQKPAPSRKEKGQGTVAITNESLVKDPNRGRLTTSQVRLPAPTPVPAPSAGAAPAVRLPDSAATPAAGAAPSTGGDEAVWRERARSARRRVEELKAEVTQLEADTKQLETDFYRWDDGQYRDRVIKPSWDKKREELETRRRQLVDAEAELADLPEKARKAGALPGWLRE
ncbi:MAG TPA: hypothetical protein VE007_11380 [Thermoanaerobaculia bacterium]|nr:hypothetical protein [Thermoanaerobaculia bacterium]